MKKTIFFIITLICCAGVINAQTIKIDSLKYRATDSSVLVYFDTLGTWSGAPTNYDYSFNGGGTWTILSPASTRVDTIRIPDANGYSSVKIRAIINSPAADTINSNIFNTANPLPVTWAGYGANKTEAGNQVWFKTASEKNTDYFQVCFSTDANALVWDSTSISRITAAGNSATLNEYSTLHTGNFSGLVYYYIKQVDLDGLFEKTPKFIAKVGNAPSGITTATSQVIAIYPNPSNGQFTVETNSIEPAEIIITNTLGRQVYNELVSHGEVLNLYNVLPCGIYYTDVAGQKIKIVIQ